MTPAKVNNAYAKINKAPAKINKTPDYFDFAILISNSQANKPIEELDK